MTRSARGWAYWTARRLGDIEAAERGPASYGRRVVRRRVYRGTNRTLARLLRRAGL